MECCLLCLSSENMMVGGIKVNSVQWKAENIKYIIEKHLWSMDTGHTYDTICIVCWKELEKFHRFYLLIEKAHATLCTIVTPKDVKESIQNTNNTSEHPKLPNGIESSVEIEILMQQPFSTENEALLGDKTLKQRRKRGQPTINLLNDLNQNNKNPVQKNKMPKSLENYKKKTLNEFLPVAPLTGETLSKSNIPLDAKNNKGSDKDYADNNEKTSGEILYKKRKNPDKKTQEEHERIIAEHLKISCCLCQIPLDNFIALRKHFRVEHKKRAFMVCCKKKFFNRPVLVEHLNSHLDPSYFKCKLCEKVYSDRRALDKHVKIHMKGEQGRNHTCVECDKSFVDTTQLDNHKLTHAPSYEKKFSCSECGKFFTTLYNLNYHIKAIHRNKYAKVCDICGKTIRNSFKLHMEKHDDKLANPIHCDHCGIRLIDKRSLKQHKNSQHPVGGKKEHSCHICQKVSTSLRALRTHIRFAHEMGHMHKCTLCDKAFKRPEALKEHIATHTGTPLYFCPWCPKTFKSNGNMYNHRKNAHSKKWEELKRQKYIDTTLKDDFLKTINAD